jgi:hypothetical protein
MANGKEPTMKPTNLIWVLALAGAMTACNSGPPITNEDNGGTGGNGTGGTGGNGTGGTGGVTEGACTDEANADVYANLTYIDDAGATFTGDEAAAAIGSDCIFGTEVSTPPLPGCGAEASAVLTCFPSGCPDETINALADCVAACVQDATAEVSAPGLSDECVACTGDTVACGAAFCTTACVADTNAPQCIQCRCDNDCIQEFDACSGLPSGGECN